ncbi:MAG: MFS transporter [Gammaproteobacteria bacterium]|nr:MFS transporter [Gammaproteobacteria bacterium]
MPYWRLSSFYLFYFAALGVLAPYWSLYLKDLGYNAVAIGELMAIPMATKLLAPYVWGWLGDHLGHRMSIVRLGSMLTAVIFTSVFWVSGFWELALIMVLFSFFWNAVLPQFEAVTFDYLGEDVSRYARVRVWGSIGFVLTVLVLGVAVDAKGPRVILPVMLVIYAAIWISSTVIKDGKRQPHRIEQPPILDILRMPAVMAFFLVCFLLQAGHGPYYAFYSIYMESVGYSKTVIGQFWALGVIAEVIVFIFMHRLLKIFGARQVLMVSLGLAVVRWVLIGQFPHSMGIILFAQVLHAATFGTFHAAAIHLVHHYFTGSHQGRGQALYSSLSFGAGGALGTMASGFLWESAGPGVAFGISAVLSLLALVIAWRWVVNELGDGAPGEAA